MVLDKKTNKKSPLKLILKNSLFRAGYFAGIVVGYKINCKNVFIFHRYQIGGAEFVHLKILGSINSNSLIVFLGNSENDGFLNEYKKFGTILDFGKLHKFNYFFSLGRLASSLKYNKQKLNIFGFSMEDYYLLVNCIKDDKHKIMDIIHAYNTISVCPKHLIPHINHRIVIDNNTFNHFQTYYNENNDSKFFEKIKLIYNYTELPENLQKLTNTKLKIIYVGRSTYEKRVYLVKEIARRCFEENLEVEVLLVGPDKEDEDESNPAYGSVGLITNEIELNQIYENSDIILITSIREGFPMVLMEAMAYGTIPISTSVGGIPYHLKNGITGFLVNEHDEELIINEFLKFIKVLVQNKYLVKEMSDNCRLYAKENFSKNNFNREYKRLFQES